MYSIRLLDDADKEFTEAAEWYEERSDGLGITKRQFQRSAGENFSLYNCLYVLQKRRNDYNQFNFSYQS